MTEGNVLFVRNDKANGVVSGSDHDDAWDDTLLIRAYDKAVNSAKEKLIKSLEALENDESNVDSSSVVEEGNSPKRKKKHESRKRTWKVGNSCRAVYSLDDEEYEAEIVKMLPNGKSCIVRYYGYGNEEEVSLDDLLPSLGKEEIELQTRCAEEERGSWCVGDLCRAVYSGDGMEYEAEIMKIYTGPNSALIRFLGYGNQEEVCLDDLSPSLGPKEVELQIVKAHTEYALYQSGSYTPGIAVAPKTYVRSSGRAPQNGHASPSQTMPPPPTPANYYNEAAARGSSQAPAFPGPPPINMNMGNVPMPILAPPSIEMMLHAPHTETDALTAMLMSWYMSGYHTGYYQGLKHSQGMNCEMNSSDRKSATSPGKCRSPPRQKHH